MLQFADDIVGSRSRCTREPDACAVCLSDESPYRHLDAQTQRGVHSSALGFVAVRKRVCTLYQQYHLRYLLLKGRNPSCYEIDRNR
jgi:hypothetical protein